MHSTSYTVIFAAAVCFVCAIFVAGSAVLLADKQEENKILDRREKVIAVAGLVGEGEKLDAAEINSRYEANVVPLVVDLQSGEIAEGVDPVTFDQAKVAANPATSREAPVNDAKVRRLPNQALIYQLKEEGHIGALIFPVEGKGLWSTLYGFIALDADAQTIEGITFYQHGETPGLGGEIDNPRWKSLWKGRKAFGDDGVPKIAVKKGQAGPPEADPYHIDGLSGATLTSRGVTNLVQFWLGSQGFGPYIAKYKATAAR